MTQDIDVVDRVERLFTSLIAGDTDAIKSLPDASEMKFVDGHLIFTLDGLYQRLFSAKSDITFPIFQQRLYKSNLNERLAKLNFRVEVVDSKGKVADNWYSLTPIN